jgi:hypothetical protein
LGYILENAKDVKAKFDDVYRALLLIGPILSFAFSNYTSLVDAKNFVYNIGYPFLIGSIFLWAVPHLIGGKREYSIKLFGLVLIWFAAFGLFFIVYLNDTRGIVSLVIDVLVTVVITFIAGDQLRKVGLISSRLMKAMPAFIILIGLATFPLLS